MELKPLSLELKASGAKATTSAGTRQISGSALDRLFLLFLAPLGAFLAGFGPVLAGGLGPVLAAPGLLWAALGPLLAALGLLLAALGLLF